MYKLSMTGSPGVIGPVAPTAGAVGCSGRLMQHHAERQGRNRRTGASRTPRATASDDGAVLIFDSLGRIRSFTSAAIALLGGRTSAQLVGQAVASLVPGLPIRNGTPGYNAAFVAFWFGEGQWWTHDVLGADGQTFELAISIEPIDCTDGGGFMMSLRLPHIEAKDAEVF